MYIYIVIVSCSPERVSKFYSLCFKENLGFQGTWRCLAHEGPAGSAKRTGVTLGSDHGEISGVGIDVPMFHITYWGDNLQQPKKGHLPSFTNP